MIKHIPETNKAIIATVIFVALIISLIITPINAKAEAIAPWIADSSDSSLLEYWKWADEIKLLDNNFNIETSSYVITQDRSVNDYRYAYPVNYSVKWNNYTIYWITSGNLQVSISDYSTFGNTYKLSPTIGNTIKKATIHSNAPTLGFPTGEYKNGMYADSFSSITTPMPYPILNTNQWDNANSVSFIMSQNNLLYTKSYTDLALPNSIKISQNDFNTPIPIKCIGFDLQCWFTKTLVPDTATIGYHYQILKDQLEVQLGFVATLIGKVSDINDIFTSTNEHWCTLNDCTKNFGNFIGQPFTINFAIPKQIIGTNAWNSLQALVTGYIAFFFFLGIKSKYLNLLKGSNT